MDDEMKKTCDGWTAKVYKKMSDERQGGGFVGLRKRKRAREPKDNVKPNPEKPGEKMIKKEIESLFAPLPKKGTS